MVADAHVVVFVEKITINHNKLEINNCAKSLKSLDYKQDLTPRSFNELLKPAKDLQGGPRCLTRSTMRPLQI